MTLRTVALRTAFAAYLCCYATAQQLTAEPARESRPGVYRGYSEARYSEWTKKSQYVAVRDGVRLAVDIYRPAVNGRAVDERFPVIWTHTPYRRAYVEPTGKIMTSIERQGWLELVKYGYVLAAVDTRGRGASFGVRRGFQDRTEARDAYDVTEWLAAQPWSTGAIGVTGCSYVGGTTWHAATTMAPHLRAIAPGCTDFDKYGFVSRGGVTAQFNTRPEDPGRDFGQGVLPVDEDKDGKVAQAAIAAHAAGTPMAELWRGMPYRDDVSPLLGVPFWREASVATYREDIERSGIGVFIWGNWLDEGSFEATLAFNNLRNPRKLWMGAWGHCQVGDFPMATELLRFFDHFLKNVDNGWEREPPIYYRTVNAPAGKEWSSAREWPLKEAKRNVLHLAGDAGGASHGGLSLQPATTAAEAADRFVVDYKPQCTAPGTGAGVRVDTEFMMWPCLVENHGVSYTSEPLAADLHIAGHAIADLWIASSASDADVFVYLENVTPSGDLEIVTHGRLRASHRAEQPAPYREYMGVPYHRGNRSDAQPLTPGKPVRLRLDLLPTSTIIKAGHRLRLTIAGADPRQRSRTVQFDPPPTIAVYRDQQRPSQLALPVRTDVQLRTRDAVAPPDVSGPIAVTADSEPYGAANARGAPTAVDLGKLGYVEEEYFVSGRANAYRYDDAFTLQVAQKDIPYTTRLLLRRPADLRKFTGVVHMESAHPVQGGHLGWSATGAYIMRRGDAYALLQTGEDALTRGGPIAPEREALRKQLQSGAQPLGAMDVLRRFDPKRYAPLVWPEDDAPRWDAFAQAGAWLKSSAASNPLREHVQRIYAQGWSFTGSLLRTFINEGFHERARLPGGAPVFDGYLIGISSSTFVSGVIALTTGGPTLPIGHARRVTRSLDVPVIELMTENEAVTNTGPQAPQNDRGFGRHRLYEVGGLTHGDGLTPRGAEPTTQFQLTQHGLPVRRRDDACQLERSDIPFHLLARAALANLHAWVEKDLPPPRAARVTLDAQHGAIRDHVGNAQGGVRVAQLEAPLAVYAVPGADASPGCRSPAGPFLNIRRVPLERATLEERYGDKDAFLGEFDAHVQRLVEERWLLPEDAALEREAARIRVQQLWNGT
jgi:hypothetical protein